MLKKSENKIQYLNEKNMNPFYSETKIPHYLIVCAALAILSLLSFLAFQYIKAWPIAYSSDTALIGLMAKHILEFGERPIFVWSVGYQGIFLEGYLSAFFFSIFGVKPWVLNIAPSIYLVIGSAFWMLGIAKSFGRTTALIAILLTTLSTPTWYYQCARTMPNFASIFMLGSLFFVLAQRCFEEFRFNTLFKNRWLFLLGLIAGFAQYTFAIHFYFIASTLFLAALVNQRNSIRQLGILIFLKNCAWPAFWLQNSDFIMTHKNSTLALRFIKAISIAAWAVILVGILTLNINAEPYEFQGRNIRWNGLKMCIIPIFILLGINCAFWAFNILKNKPIAKSYKSSFAHFTIAFVLGYSPALIHKFIIGGNSIKNVGIQGTWKVLTLRFSYFIEFHKSHLGMNFQGYWGWTVALIFIFGITIFYVRLFKTLNEYLSSKNNSNNSQWPWSTVYGIFPLITLAIFMVSRTVVDVHSVRYLVYLIPVYASMLATSALWLWKIHKTGPYLSSILVLLFAFQGWQRLQNDIAAAPITPETTMPEFAIEKAMLERGIKVGYSDYWLAYSTVLIANEKVILEPLDSNYSPHYAQPVQNASRIVYVDFTPSKSIAYNGILTLKEQQYRVLEEVKISPSVEMKVLERIQFN